MAFAKEMMGAGFSAGQAKGSGGGYATLAATGSAQGDAAAVVASMTLATAADGTKGVILPAAEVGDECWIFNNSGSTLKVYPPAGSAIAVPGTGVGSANAAFSHLTYKTMMYKYFSSTQIVPVTSA
jgi:hypothetical protein